MAPIASIHRDLRDPLAWEALGTSVVVQITDESGAARARLLVERELAAIDRACSRFREDSELSRTNRCAGRTVHVDPLLVDALRVALRAAERTDGNVDPTLGRALILAGYDRDWKLIADAESHTHGRQGAGAGALEVLARPVSGWRAIEFDPERSMVRVPRGLQLDLGATAKAWAADRAVKAVHRDLGCGALVSLGGDVATAGVAPAGGWRVHVTDDHRAGPDAPGQTVTILSGGLATSSVAVRRWRRNGREMHHIIDPATGLPLRGIWRTVSVAAADCTDANIAATAALLRDDFAVQWLTELDLPARLVDHDGAVRRTCGWPAGEREKSREG